MSHVDAAASFAESQYRSDAQRHASVAADLRAAGKPLHARKFSNRAYIALNAARCEVFDPEPVEGPWCVCEACTFHLLHVRFNEMFKP